MLSPSGTRRPLLIAASVYLLVALAWSWPLPIHLANRFTHDPGDPLLVTYLAWWNAHAVPFTRTWWNAPFFWPFPDALALTEHLAGLSPLTTPVQWLGGSPLLASNLAIIASVWWTGLATHALVRRLTGSTAASYVGGLAFAYAPYHISQAGHLQLFACWWMPLALLALHAWMDGGGGRWLLVFGVSWLLQALTNGYALFFFPLLLAGWIAWFTPWRTHARRAAAAGVTWFLFSLPLAPVLLEYYRVQSRLGVGRTRSEMIFFSAEWRSFLCATPELRFWHTAAPNTTESYLFPGVTVVLLVAAAALWRLRTRPFLFYVAAAAVTVALCFGPAPAFSIASLWHPYDWLVRLPGFSGLRVPPRFFMITALCLAIAAGLAFAHISARVRWPRAVACLVFAGLFIDGSIAGMPLGVPPGRLEFAERGAHLLALPVDDASLAVATMYRSMFHGMAVVNGYAGYVPPHADVIQWALRRRDPTLLTELRRGHPLFVIVAPSEDAAFWQQFIESQPGAESLGVSGGGHVFRLAPAAYPISWPPARAFRGAAVTVTGDALLADLGRVETVSGVEVATRGNLVRLPEAVRVETSLDGRNWVTASDERPGGAALLGSLREPKAIPVRVEFRGVPARYVRVNTPLFGAAALIVLGP